jgi:hypothetical protein
MDRNLVLLNQNIARLRRDVRLQSFEIEQLIAADLDRTTADARSGQSRALYRTWREAHIRPARHRKRTSNARIRKSDRGRSYEYCGGHGKSSIEIQFFGVLVPSRRFCAHLRPSLMRVPPWWLLCATSMPDALQRTTLRQQTALCSN